VTGGTYAHGSFSHLVHLYLHTPALHEDRVLRLLIGALPSVFRWFGGLLNEFTVHTDAAVATGPVVPALQRFESKWLKLGVNLLNSGFPSEAQQVFLRWYQAARASEIACSQRLHKGTAIWWIARSFEALRAEDDARCWHLLALLEDVRNDPSTWQAFGAWGSLTTQLQVDPAAVRSLGNAAQSYCAAQPWDPGEPETVWLAVLPHRARFTRAPLPFLRVLAGFLLAKTTTPGLSKKQLGDSLETLMKYLFASERGFEVLGDSSAPDAQHDVVVRNGHDDAALIAMGDYLLVECKNWTKLVRAPVVREFAGRLQSAAVKTGVLVARAGISGGTQHATRAGARLTIGKEFAQDRTAILVLSEQDLRDIAQGTVSFSTRLLSVFEDVRFDRI